MWLEDMIEVRNLSYLVLGVSDLDAWVPFATDVIGLQIGGRMADSMTLRMDENAYRLILTKDPANDIKAAGWQLDSALDLETFVTRLRSSGVLVNRADEKLVAARQVADLYTCEDPNGIQLEFFYGPSIACKPFRSKVIQGRFRTGTFGLGHFVACTNDFDRSVKFYRDFLGMPLSGYMKPEDLFDVAFFHTASRCFHSVAMADFSNGKRLAHIGIEVDDLTDVGLALDRATRAGVPITATLGHHPNSDTVSFYVRSPSGFEFEVGTGEIVLEKDNWQVKTYFEFSDWGHHRASKGAPKESPA
jgi:2,3-dihydroxybiphenyl 1,2-dioxygenase